MSPKARLKHRKSSKAMYKPLPLNFLLGCSENSLANFELARLDEMAQLRKELQLVLDRLLDQMSQAAIAGWFRQSDRNAIKYALENEETPLQMAAHCPTARLQTEAAIPKVVTSALAETAEFLP
jgi:hypothetical protein